MIQYISPKMLTEASLTNWANKNNNCGQKIEDIIQSYPKAEGLISYKTELQGGNSVLMPVVEVSDEAIKKKILDVISDSYYPVPVSFL
jgi:hypothetical protein